MSSSRHRAPLLPDHWTPAEALAMFEMLDLLRDQLWHHYQHAIQHALREDIRIDRDPRQYDLPLDRDPF